jgi:hypothetical protein
MKTQKADWLETCIEQLTFLVVGFRYGLKSELRQLANADAVQDIRAGMAREFAERERACRLDEHRILAGLDEEGRKQRYLDLAQEGR